MEKKISLLEYYSIIIELLPNLTEFIEFLIEIYKIKASNASIERYFYKNNNKYLL